VAEPLQKITIAFRGMLRVNIHRMLVKEYATGQIIFRKSFHSVEKIVSCYRFLVSRFLKWKSTKKYGSLIHIIWHLSRQIKLRKTVATTKPAQCLLI